MSRILVVEDNSSLNTMLCDAIELSGNQAESVTTRKAALERLAAGTYDLVVSDLRLPDGSGRDIADRGALLGIRTLLVTGDLDAARGFEKAGLRHLRKPFDIVQFLEMVAIELLPRGQ